VRLAGVTAAAIGVAAIPVAVAILFHNQGSSAPDQGPLQSSVPGVTVNLIPVEVGQRVTVGLSLPTRRVHRLTLDGLRPVRPEHGIKVLGYRVLYPSENSGGLEGADGFPPPHWKVHPLRGTAVAGNAAATEILVGLEATTVGVHNVLAFVVSYHVGARRYRALIYHGVTLCAPDLGGRDCVRRSTAHLVTASQVQDALGKYTVSDLLGVS
jgi:hypothetical protein